MSATKAIAKFLKLTQVFMKIAGVRFRRDRCTDAGGETIQERGAMPAMRPTRSAGAQSSSNPPVDETCRWRVEQVTLGYAPREIVCRTHGRTEEEIPWAARHVRGSAIASSTPCCACARSMTQKAAAQLLQMPASTLSDTACTAALNAIVVAIVCGDFGSSASTRSPTASATSTRRWSMTWSARSSCQVGQGRGRATIDQFFDHQLSDYQKSQIHTGCCDMSEAYMCAISSHCPNAQLVLDRFHIVKALNDAIDDVRKEQWREASAADLKSSQAIALAAVPAFIHSFAPGHADSSGRWEKHNRRIYRAWRLKDEFEQLWTFNANVGGTAILQAMDDLCLT